MRLSAFRREPGPLLALLGALFLERLEASPPVGIQRGPASDQEKDVVGSGSGPPLH